MFTCRKVGILKNVILVQEKFEYEIYETTEWRTTHENNLYGNELDTEKLQLLNHGRWDERDIVTFHFPHTQHYIPYVVPYLHKLPMNTPIMRLKS